LVGKSILDFLETEEEKKQLVDYLQYLVQEQPIPSPWISKERKKDGEVIDLRVHWNYKRDQDGKVIGFISLLTDITEEKKLQEDLQESKSKFQSIFEHSPLAIMYTDADGTIATCNANATKLFGASEKKLIGYSFQKIKDERLRSAIADALEGHKTQFEGEFKTAEGNVLTHLKANFSPSFDEDGAVSGVIGIFEDISEHIKADQALMESEEKFQLLMDSLEAIVYVADMDTYEILFLNKYGREVLGDVTGKICWQSIQDGQTGPCDFCTNKYIIDAGGNPVSPYIWDFQNTLTGLWFHIIDRAIKWTDGRIVRLEIATDISENKKAEQDLKESEEKYSKLFNSEIAAIAIFDAETRKIVDCNDAFLNLYGYSREEALKLLADDISAEPEKTVFSIKKGDARVRRRLHKQKDGTVIVVDIAAGPLMLQGRKLMFARLQDITEHVEAEKELQELEKRFRIAFRTSPDSININKMDGTYVEINDGFIDLTGYTRKDVIGKSSLDINIWRRPEDRKALVEGLQKSGQVTNLEADFRMKDGSIKTALMSANLIHLHGEPHILNITRDITDRKKAEREKAKLEAQLRQVYKMEAIGTMAGGIAHDFNNILTIIVGNADLAKYVAKDNGPGSQYIDKILEASGRAKEMVRQILAFSRQTKQNLVPIRPHLVLSETLNLLRSTIPVSIDMQHDLDTKCRTVKADPTQLNQVLMNLCANAVHAMDEKGMLKVSLQEVKLVEEDTKHKTNMKPGPYALLSVTDTGKGMSPELKERIFDPFFTTKKVGEGTGMGLSVVHGIVENHGGMISVKSALGKGTTFYIYFPIVDESTVMVRKNGSIQHKGNEHILFVDDEEPLVEIATEMLQMHGYRVTAKTNSEEALEAFKNSPDNFDLVITDQTMPNMSGSELASALLRTRPDLPIILCTGYSSKISDEMAKKIGIADYFLKPFDTEKLLRFVRKVLDSK
jgi:PAS domain S-box-containing protein